MKEKCKWENGEFVECCEGIGLIGGDVVIRADDGFYRGSGGISYSFCPFCGANIHKPEPKVTIKKSGETLVAQYDDVNLICHDPEEHEALTKNLEDGETEAGIIQAFPHIWEPISEIEITDEIAKLRPVVVWGWNRQNRDILCRVRPDGVFILENGSGDEKFLLATVDDLP